jgi:hypothetical protein
LNAFLGNALIWHLVAAYLIDSGLFILFFLSVQLRSGWRRAAGNEEQALVHC